MNELHFPWLELAVMTPLLGAAVARGAGSDRARWVALLASSVALLLTLGAWVDLAAIHRFEAHDHLTLLGWLPGGDPLVVDELSAPLLPLAALQFLLTFLATLRTKGARFSFALTLASEALVLATLACKSPWLIALLMAASVVPVAVEVARRGVSPRVFLVHMELFVALLVGGLALRALADGPGSTLDAAGIALVALAVLVRSAAAPSHLWLLDLFDSASFGAALLFVTPMTAAYAALRLLLPAAPEWVLRGVALASLATALYAAAMALVQRDARRVYACLLLSHASLVLAGLEIVTLLGLTGALCVWLSVGLAMTGFGLTLRCVEGRVGRIDVTRYNGLHDASPTLAALFLLTGLASIGFPGTVGFIAIELLVEGAAHAAPAVGVVALVATGLNGVAVLHAYFRIFTGAPHASTISLGVRPAERAAVLVLAALILGGGVYPQPGVASRRHAAQGLLDQRRVAVATPRAEPPRVATRPIGVSRPTPHGARP